VEVEHVLDEGALEAGAEAGEEREAGAAHAGGTLEVEEAERGAELDVVLRLEVEGALGAPAAVLDVVGGVGAAGDAFVRDVRDLEHPGLEALVEVADFGVEGGNFFADGLHLGLDGGGVLAVLLEDADLLGDGVALGLEVVDLGDGGAAAGVGGEEGVEIDGRAAVLEAFADGAGFSRISLMSNILAPFSSWGRVQKRVATCR